MATIVIIPEDGTSQEIEVDSYLATGGALFIVQIETMYDVDGTPEDFQATVRLTKTQAATLRDILNNALA